MSDILSNSLPAHSKALTLQWRAQQPTKLQRSALLFLIYIPFTCFRLITLAYFFHCRCQNLFQPSPHTYIPILSLYYTSQDSFQKGQENGLPCGLISDGQAQVMCAVELSVLVTPSFLTQCLWSSERSLGLLTGLLGVGSQGNTVSPPGHTQPQGYHPSQRINYSKLLTDNCISQYIHCHLFLVLSGTHTFLCSFNVQQFQSHLKRKSVSFLMLG